MDVGAFHTSGRNRLAAAIAALLHPDDIARLEEALNRSLASGESFSLNYRMRRADGAYRWMSGRAEPLRDESGLIVQWYGLSHDIDDQVRIEEALRERERFLRQMIETLPAMIDCAAPDGEPIYRSRQLREFLGDELEQLDGTDVPVGRHTRRRCTSRRFGGRQGRLCPFIVHRRTVWAQTPFATLRRRIPLGRDPRRTNAER